jgi:hypothetical protein
MLNKANEEETIFSFSTDMPEQDPRRQSPRIRILRVGTLIVDGRRELCLIRNVSAGGLIVHIYSEFHIGQRVTVELKSSQPVGGTIMWVNESNAGVQFDRPIDVEELLSNQIQEDGWQPRMPRVEVDRLATLRIGAHTITATVQDISQGGVRVEVDTALEPGEDVIITLEKFRPIPGVIRWFQGGLGGIAFNEVLRFHELMAWLRPKG